MPATGTIIFSDPDDYQAYVRTIGIDLLFTRLRGFKASLTLASLPSLYMLAVQENLPRIAQWMLAPEQVVVGFPMRARTPQIWAGMQVGPREIVLPWRGERLYQWTSGPSSWGSMVLPRACLA